MLTYFQIQLNNFVVSLIKLCFNVEWNWEDICDEFINTSYGSNRDRNLLWKRFFTFEPCLYRKVGLASSSLKLFIHPWEPWAGDGAVYLPLYKDFLNFCFGDGGERDGVKANLRGFTLVEQSTVDPTELKQWDWKANVYTFHISFSLQAEYLGQIKATSSRIFPNVLSCFHAFQSFEGMLAQWIK